MIVIATIAIKIHFQSATSCVFTLIWDGTNRCWRPPQRDCCGSGCKLRERKIRGGEERRASGKRRGERLIPALSKKIRAHSLTSGDTQAAMGDSCHQAGARVVFFSFHTALCCVPVFQEPHSALPLFSLVLSQGCSHPSTPTRLRAPSSALGCQAGACSPPGASPQLPGQPDHPAHQAPGEHILPRKTASCFQGPRRGGTSGTSRSRAARRCKQPRARARACPPAAAPGSVYGGTYAVQWVCSACGVSHCCQAQCPFLVPKSGTIPCKWAQIHPKTQTKEEVAQSSLVWAPRDSCTGRDFTRARRISV